MKAKHKVNLSETVKHLSFVVVQKCINEGGANLYNAIYNADQVMDDIGLITGRQLAILKKNVLDEVYHALIRKYEKTGIDYVIYWDDAETIFLASKEKEFRDSFSL